MQGAATSIGTIHSQVLTSELAIEKPCPVIPCWTSYAM